jgi:hypothetical protein
MKLEEKCLLLICPGGSGDFGIATGLELEELEYQKQVGHLSCLR